MQFISHQETQHEKESLFIASDRMLTRRQHETSFHVILSFPANVVIKILYAIRQVSHRRRHPRRRANGSSPLGKTRLSCLIPRTGVPRKARLMSGMREHVGVFLPATSGHLLLPYGEKVVFGGERR